MRSGIGMSHPVADETLATLCIDTLAQQLKAPLRALPVRPRPAFRRAVLSVPGTRPFSVSVAADRASYQALAEAHGQSPDDMLGALVHAIALRLRLAFGHHQPIGRPRILDGLWAFCGVAASRSRWALEVEGCAALIDVELSHDAPQ